MRVYVLNGYVYVYYIVSVRNEMISISVVALFGVEFNKYITVIIITICKHSIVATR